MVKILLCLSLLFSVTMSSVIKKGDVLNITVKGEEALSKTVIVDENGKIDYPMFSDRVITRMTTAELMDNIALKLAKHLENPFVLVSKEFEATLTITMLGQINNPGRIAVPQRGSIQEAIKLAGGTTEFSNLSNIKLIREGESDRDAQYIDLKLFLETGQSTLLPEIKNNDTYIITTSSSSKLVMVRGAVRKPGAYSTYSNATILDLIHLAGGPKDNANFKKVRHISGQGDKRTDMFVDLQEFVDAIGKNENIPLAKEGDVIYVLEKSVTWTKFMSFLRDITTALTLTFLIYNTLN